MNPLVQATDKVTIGDVARLAGVSIKTVSRVANGLPYVRDETRKKVQQAIDTLGYTANPYAKHLGSIRSSENEPSEPVTQTVKGIHSAKPTGDNQDIDWW